MAHESQADSSSLARTPDESYSDSCGDLRFDCTPQWGRLTNSDAKAESPWARKVVLSLDGGGVRGYSSLLILEKIMEKIQEIETVQAPKCRSSKSYPWSGHTIDAADGVFSPHHYIDYFVGTSTGGLSAMMLGRLHMPIESALEGYQVVGRKVFGRPRKFTMKGVLAPRYKQAYMERVLQSLTQKDMLHPKEDTTDRIKSKSARRGWITRKADKVRLRTGNPDAPRTVVVAYKASAGTRSPYLFRSYEHPEPNPYAHADDKRAHFNPGPASDLPLWQIGRGTSAAPTYFSPTVIGRDQFIDGGLSGSNNPTKLAYDEVRQMHWKHQPFMMLSLGTGVKPDAPRSEAHGRLKAIGILQNLSESWKSRKILQDNVLDSHQKHIDFHQKIKDINNSIYEHEKIIYYRFNVPAEHDMTSIKLGEWKGHNGTETSSKMADMTKQYLAKQTEDIRLCAQQLVNLRRQRAVTERWERFALHKVYCCPLEDDRCGKTLFDSRSRLRQHLIRSHGYVWQVPCHTKDDRLVYKWSCFWDQCGEEKVYVFDCQDHFLAHLKDEHGIMNPQVKTIGEIEMMLDQGRNDKVMPASPQTTGLYGRRTLSSRPNGN